MQNSQNRNKGLTPENGSYIIRCAYTKALQIVIKNVKKYLFSTFSAFFLSFCWCFQEKHVSLQAEIKNKNLNTIKD